MVLLNLAGAIFRETLGCAGHEASDLVKLSPLSVNCLVAGELKAGAEPFYEGQVLGCDYSLGRYPSVSQGFQLV